MKYGVNWRNLFTFQFNTVHLLAYFEGDTEL